MSALHVQGMHGMGDNLHQRMVIAQLLRRGHDIWLDTPWPSIYHDMQCPRLQLLDKRSPLRTQSKNAAREAALYDNTPIPPHAQAVRVHYPPALVRQTGSVLGAMAAFTGTQIEDFRLPVPAQWVEGVSHIVAAAAGRPIMVLRPLMDRKEWGGAAARNPDPQAYAKLFAILRERFYVVSVADLEDKREWLVPPALDADLKLHAGELEFRDLAGLFSVAKMVFTSPGFAVPLAQAVRAPVICIFGGYENAQSFSAGARYSRYLGIDPIRPCNDFAHNLSHPKAIDIAAASARIREFAG